MYHVILQIVINPDGTFTVNIADSPAGSVPFEKVEVTFEVPTGGVTVDDLTTTACVHPGKRALVSQQLIVVLVIRSWL